ncbi:MAG: LytR/AlgR family response regulator transcription factor [Chitinophagaceae bacterium]
MLRCIAIDDEPLALELLEDNISKVSFLELVASCSNPIEAINVLKEKKVDLIFLDIQMPGLTGLQFIQSLIVKPMFILITAYEKYALEGYHLDVVDYLVKPVPLDRFIKACNKAWELYQLKNKKTDTSIPSSSLEYIFVNVEYSLLKVVLKDILWIEGLKDYIKIYLKSAPNKPIITRISMKAMEDELPPLQFARVHKSFIISKEHITALRKNSIFIGSMEVPVGENYKEVIERITGKN